MNDAADLEHHPAVLARLHAQLHEIPFQAATLLHRDLHPENVILSPARRRPERHRRRARAPALHT
jgi:hypothetical protein